MADKKKKEQTPEKEPMMKVQQLRPPKLKDMPRNRSRITLPLKQVFGFIPEIIFIDKVRGTANKLIISAVLPKEMADRFEEGEPIQTDKKKKDD